MGRDGLLPNGIRTIEVYAAPLAQRDDDPAAPALVQLAGRFFRDRFVTDLIPEQ